MENRIYGPKLSDYALVYGCGVTARRHRLVVILCAGWSIGGSGASENVLVASPAYISAAFDKCRNLNTVRLYEPSTHDARRVTWTTACHS